MGPKILYPLAYKKCQFFRDILLPNNILGILTRVIVETIFFEYFTRKKRGRGGIHTPPSVGLRAINPLFTIFFGQKWILHVKISMGTR